MFNQGINYKTIKKLSMKKAIVGGVIGIFAFGMFSCGHGTCDAYRTADYTKYKKEQLKKVEVITEFSKSK